MSSRLRTKTPKTRAEALSDACNSIATVSRWSFKEKTVTFETLYGMDFRTDLVRQSRGT